MQATEALLIGIGAVVTGGELALNLVILFSIALVLVFAFALLTNGVAGWGTLRRHFPSQADDERGRILRRGSGRIGGVRFENCLTLRLTDSGIHVDRLNSFHRPVFVPWSQVRKVHVRRFAFLARVPLLKFMHCEFYDLIVDYPERFEITLPPPDFAFARSFLHETPTEEEVFTRFRDVF